MKRPEIAQTEKILQIGNNSIISVLYLNTIPCMNENNHRYSFLKKQLMREQTAAAVLGGFTPPFSTGPEYLLPGN